MCLATTMRRRLTRLYVRACLSRRCVGDRVERVCPGRGGVLSWEPERPRLHPRQGFAWDLRGPGRQRVHWAGGVLAWAIDRCNRVGRDSRRPPPSRGRRRRRGEPRRTKTTRLFQQVTGPGTRLGPVVTLPPPLYRGLAPVGTRSPGRGSTHPGVRGDRRPATAAA